MTDIKIGKFVLESLTAGMYADAFVIYREYIQNSADSIDLAIQGGLVSPEKAYIEVSIDKALRSIIITDNGEGIHHQLAKRVLTHIGQSHKTYKTNRGFRGIGRLAGLSYCDKLTFATTCAGDEKESIISFDAKKLSQHLSEQSAQQWDILQVMDDILSISYRTVKKDAHYFRVTMENVPLASDLLDFSKVHDYLQQVAPVPFHPTEFSWANEISSNIRSLGMRIDEYTLILKDTSKTVQIFKPYQDYILVNRQNGAQDSIIDVQYNTLFDLSGNPCGAIWHGVSSFQSTIVDKSVRGLRIRVGNLLLGDSSTLSPIFKESRFNGWLIGELHISNAELIPNARRDDFEKNDAYYHLNQQLTTIARGITKSIRKSVLKRNKQLEKQLEKADAVAQNANTLLHQEFVAKEKKNNMCVQISTVKDALAGVETTNVDEQYKYDVLDQLDLLTGMIDGATSYRILNVQKGLTVNEKKLLERIFNHINNRYSEDESQKCVSMVLAALD